MNILMENILIGLEKVNDQFKLVIDDNGSNVEIILNKEQALLLGEQFVKVGLICKPVKDNAYYRSLAIGIITLDDKSIQKILRLIQSRELIDFLWFMKNTELVKKIFKNISIKAAAMLTEDLEKEFKEFGDPDDPKNTNCAEKRTAIKEIMSIAEKLYRENEIPYFEGVDILKDN